MLSMLKIPKMTAEAALDHHSLFKEGLKNVQDLARRVWTDYNVHDPGVTALELLCYTLTDLGYRASFPVEDMLATDGDNAEPIGGRFFTAREILHTRPLTTSDYRKLLTDIAGVRNAWVRPAALTYIADTVEGRLMWPKERPAPGHTVEKVEVRGLYEVLLDFTDDAADEAARKKVKAEALRVLHANRNLCEDFVTVSEIKPEQFILCCELDLNHGADVSLVKANILFEVQQYLSPTLRNHSLAGMLNLKGPDGAPRNTYESIFDGPALGCGFIDDDELAASGLRTEIRLSDIVNIIMDVDGVQAVRDIIVSPLCGCDDKPLSPPSTKWVLPVTPWRKALLHMERSRTVFYKRGMPVVPDEARCKSLYENMRLGLVSMVDTKVPEDTLDLPVPAGRFRSPSAYYSFQNHFPAVYGLGGAGLGDSADDRRKALAYQLKAYCLFFDQLMADFLAQLGGVGRLFSAQADLETYFHQKVDTFRDYEDIYRVKDVEGTLGKLEDVKTHIDRRSRFLDHLIARFAERFNEYAGLMASAFDTSPEELISMRCEFLKDYPAISGGRAVAYDYTLSESNGLWDTCNVSGLERRLARLLGIRDWSRRNLGSISCGGSSEVEGTAEEGFHFRIRENSSDRILLSGVKKYTTHELASDAMWMASHLARSRDNYDLKTSAAGKYYFNVIDGQRNIVATRVGVFFETEKERDDAVDGLVGYLRQNCPEEGMYLVENILLRPEKSGEPFLPISVSSSQASCADRDPYSCRVNIILPAYADRFSNMDFRRYAEEVIREETPAHILPRICWVDRETMIGFERLYRDWLSVRAGVWPDDGTKAKAVSDFIEKLYSLKNVYPASQLRECGADESGDMFVLGRTMLGSVDEKDR